MSDPKQQFRDSLTLQIDSKLRAMGIVGALVTVYEKDAALKIEITCQADDIRTAKMALRNMLDAITWISR